MPVAVTMVWCRASRDISGTAGGATVSVLTVYWLLNGSGSWPRKLRSEGESSVVVFMKMHVAKFVFSVCPFDYFSVLWDFFRPDITVMVDWA